GKLGSAAHIQNPLKSISSHFGKTRAVNSNTDSGPDHWFTGPDVGGFGGVSYQTPWKPLQINADWGGDRYVIEKNLVSNFNTPEPWAIGATVNVMKNMSFHGALIGGEKLMGRFIFGENLAENVIKEWKKSIPFKIRKGDKSNYSPQYMGLTGKKHVLPERQIYSSVSTPAELWHDLEINVPKRDPYFKTNTFFKHKQTRLRFEEKFDVSDKVHSLLFRNAVLVENIDETALGVLTGFGLRVNMGDNLFT
ncbi:MAG: YjbH domain-containing protein, partial [Alphaproteobacteria bacterium]|nr:YjbH domain-containing protein [Alphaproteobacteria bacterium]